MSSEKLKEYLEISRPHKDLHVFNNSRFRIGQGVNKLIYPCHAYINVSNYNDVQISKLCGMIKEYDPAVSLNADSENVHVATYLLDIPILNKIINDSPDGMAIKFKTNSKMYQVALYLNSVMCEYGEEVVGYKTPVTIEYGKGDTEDIYVLLENNDELVVRGTFNMVMMSIFGRSSKVRIKLPEPTTFEMVERIEQFLRQYLEIKKSLQFTRKLL